ncbi:aminopeptidase P family protein [Candidatus Aerophobetes bacterium]|nr:aminopeptidase P family protein [Candidatus Aerophobetes bacterium]
MWIPKEECWSRVQRTQEILRKENLELALVYYDELNIANGWYLSGWCPQFESGMILVPKEGDPMILGGPESEPFAKISSAITKTRNIPVFMVPEEEYPNAYISSFGEIFQELGVINRVKKIGIVGLNTMPYGVFRSLSEDLRGVEFVDITRQFEEMRKIKTPWEIEAIRSSFEIADEGIKVMEEKIEPGVAEYEIAAVGEGKVRSLGANGFGFKTVVGSGKRSNGVVPTASDKKLEKGEILILGISPRYKGYSAAAGFTYVVGDSFTKEQNQYFRDVAEAFRITKENLVVGKSGREIDASTRKFFEKRGYSKYLVCPFVHTIGIFEAEAPFFGPNSNDVLKPNMTVCIDVSLFGHPICNGIRFETGYLITDKGPKAFSEYMERKILDILSK